MAAHKKTVALDAKLHAALKKKATEEGRLLGAFIHHILFKAMERPVVR